MPSPSRAHIHDQVGSGHSSSWRRCAGSVRTLVSGTWCAHQVPSAGSASTSAGPVQPLRARHDHRPPLSGSPAAAAPLVLDRADPPDRVVQRCCHLQMGNGVTRAGHGRRLVAVADRRDRLRAAGRAPLGLGTRPAVARSAAGCPEDISGRPPGSWRPASTGPVSASPRLTAGPAGAVIVSPCGRRRPGNEHA
jgi:hypothetical protein